LRASRPPSTAAASTWERTWWALRTPGGRKVALDEGGDPLADGEGVDAGQGRRAEVGEDLVVEQHPVGASGAGLEVRRGCEPAFGPLGEADLALGRVDVGAAQLGILDADQEPQGVGLAVEAALALPAARVAPAGPVGHPAGLDAPFDVAHPRRPF
jgi:hypothetical protein